MDKSGAQKNIILPFASEIGVWNDSSQTKICVVKISQLNTPYRLTKWCVIQRTVKGIKWSIGKSKLMFGHTIMWNTSVSCNENVWQSDKSGMAGVLPVRWLIKLKDMWDAKKSSTDVAKTSA